MNNQVVDNKSLQLDRIQKDSLAKSHMENNKFLEKKISQMMTEKEEQAI